MTTNSPREVEHEITVDAPAEDVYRLLAEVENWPRIFPPTLHVDQVDTDVDQERIRIWATANGEAKSWTSIRTFDREALRIDFRQEIPTPPVAAMSGGWIVEPLTATTSRVRLLHAYRAIDDDPEQLAWIDRAVDTNSRSELAALKTNLELAHAAEAVTFSFEDTVYTVGSAKDVYDFIDAADLWAERLPHVASVRLTEDSPGLQTLEMDTRTADGSTHTTKSYRVCLPHHRIAYKQVTLPALMSLHTGIWTFRETEDGKVAATSQHTVVLNTANITKVLGDGATVQQAEAYVRGALSRNSTATLTHATSYAEARSRP
ncbi:MULTISPECIES: aromatase/cyclase [Streptomyces]|uniref:aromatase/cyclase n=1 Tax=Streptomyces TaxID=1883 RepID=UPI0004C72986|nr:MULTISPECIES: aromatase/cyclase [Streptomyces]RPK83974.1 Putative polyketide cyclase [Streptomyces sp. ADI98-10]